MDRNKREVSFELGKEIEKDGFFVRRASCILLGSAIFSLSHTYDKTKKTIFLFLFNELKTYHLSYFYLQTLCYRHC